MKKIDKDLEKVSGGIIVEKDNEPKKLNERDFDGVHFYNKVPDQYLENRVAFYFVRDGKKDWYYGRLLETKNKTSMCVTTKYYEVECFKKGTGKTIVGYTNTVSLSEKDYTAYSDMVTD